MNIFNRKFNFKKDSENGSSKIILAAMSKLHHDIDVYFSSVEKGDYSNINISDKLKAFHEEMAQVRGRFREISDDAESLRKLHNEIQEALMKLQAIPYVVPEIKNSLFDCKESTETSRLELSEIDLIFLNAYGENHRDLTLSLLTPGKCLARSRYELACIKWREILLQKRSDNTPLRRAPEKPDRGWW